MDTDILLKKKYQKDVWKQTNGRSGLLCWESEGKDWGARVKKKGNKTGVGKQKPQYGLLLASHTTSLRAYPRSGFQASNAHLPLEETQHSLRWLGCKDQVTGGCLDAPQSPGAAIPTWAAQPLPEGAEGYFWLIYVSVGCLTLRYWEQLGENPRVLQAVHKLPALRTTPAAQDHPPSLPTERELWQSCLLVLCGCTDRAVVAGKLQVPSSGLPSSQEGAELPLKVGLRSDKQGAWDANWRKQAVTETCSSLAHGLLRIV